MELPKIIFKRGIINFLLFAFLVLSLSSVSAQSKFGVKFGKGKFIAKEGTAFNTDDGKVFTHRLDFLDFSSSTSVGLFLRKEFNVLFVETDVQYTSFSSNFLVTTFSEDVPDPELAKEIYHNLDLSVIAGIHKKGISIGVGPIFHRTIDRESQLQSFDFITNVNKSIDAGFQFMVGYSKGPFSLQAKFEDLFLNVGDHFKMSDNDSDFKRTINTMKIEFGIGF